MTIISEDKIFFKIMKTVIGLACFHLSALTAFAQVSLYHDFSLPNIAFETSRYAVVGDVDGDDYPDIGVSEVKIYEPVQKTIAYSVYSGKTLERVRYSVFTCPTLHTSEVVSLGDLNADQHDEYGLLLECTDSKDDIYSEFLILSGRDSKVIFKRKWPGFADQRAASLKDVNGDAHDDFILTVPNQNKADVFSGKTLKRLYTVHGKENAPGLGAPPSLGNGLQVVGDINGDRILDYMIANPSEAGARSAQGSVSLFSGKNGNLIKTITGNDVSDRLGNAFRPIGDYDGDGFMDAIIKDVTQEVIISGKDLSRLKSYPARNSFSRSIPDLNGDGIAELVRYQEIHDGVTLEPIKGLFPKYQNIISPRSESMVYYLTPFLDYDGDGHLDYISRYPVEFTNGHVGNLHILSGKHDGRVLKSNTLTGYETLRFGSSIQVLHSNDRSRQIIIVGADEDSSNGLYAGALYAFSVPDFNLLYTIHGDVAERRLGRDAPAIVEDVNDDGFEDFAVWLFGGGIAVYDGQTGKEISRSKQYEEDSGRLGEREPMRMPDLSEDGRAELYVRFTHEDVYDFNRPRSLNSTCESLVPDKFYDPTSAELLEFDYDNPPDYAAGLRCGSEYAFMKAYSLQLDDVNGNGTREMLGQCEFTPCVYDPVSAELLFELVPPNASREWDYYNSISQALLYDDVTGDGISEILIPEVRYPSRTHLVIYNGATGEIVKQVYYNNFFSRSSEMLRSVFLIPDLDGDGLSEISLTGSVYTKKLSYSSGSYDVNIVSSATLESIHRIYLGAFALDENQMIWPGGAVLGDLNHDGLVEVVYGGLVLSIGSNPTSILFGDSADQNTDVDSNSMIFRARQSKKNRMNLLVTGFDFNSVSTMNACTAAITIANSKSGAKNEELVSFDLQRLVRKTALGRIPGLRRKRMPFLRLSVQCDGDPVIHSDFRRVVMKGNAKRKVKYKKWKNLLRKRLVKKLASP